MESQRHELKRALGMKDVLALAFGTMIGWGWIMLAGQWVADAGVVGAILAFVIGAILCIFVGLTYAELTPALPLAGGELVFSYRGLGYTASWITGWMITFAYVGVAAWEGPALVTAVDYIIQIPRFGYLWEVAGFEVYLSWVLIGSLGGLILAYVNYKGVKSSAIFQTAATLAMSVGGILFLLGGIGFGSTENMIPVFTDGRGLVAVILMVPAMFVGFDVIPQAAEEMHIPLTTIAKVLIISICLAAAWYILMIIGISLSAPPNVRAEAAIPVAGSFAHAMGSGVFGKLMIIAALCGILTSWNGFIVGATRVIFGMGRAKMLPEVFGKVHPKYQSPTAAIILVGFFTCLSPLLGKTSLVWFVNASAFGTVVAYFMVACSFLALRKNEPELVRPYKVGAGTLVGILAIGVAALFLYLYLPFGSPSSLVWQEWTMVAVWVVLGIVLAVMTKAKYPNVSLEEREYLLFGDEYSRPDRKLKH